MYYTQYSSPLGLLTIASNGQQIIGLWMDGQKHFGFPMAQRSPTVRLPVISQKPPEKEHQPMPLRMLLEKILSVF